MELTLEKKHEIEAKANQMIECLKAILLLAGIEAKRIHQLPNGYCGDLCCPHRPWMLAETKYGPIKIGWRKRVLSIEWTDDVVNIDGKHVLAKGDEGVTTMGNKGCHAWGYAKAVEQLTVFTRIADRFLHEKEADARLTAPELEEYRRLMDAHYASGERMSGRLEELYNKRNVKLQY